MLIHGAAAMSAWDAEDASSVAHLVTLSAPPDVYQGFGRVDLSGVVLSQSSTPASNALGLWCSKDLSISSGATLSFTFHVTSSAQPLKATLVWYDPANSVSAAKQLLNDLDLTVYYGTTNTIYYSNGVKTVDFLLYFLFMCLFIFFLFFYFL